MSLDVSWNPLAGPLPSGAMLAPPRAGDGSFVTAVGEADIEVDADTFIATFAVRIEDEDLVASQVVARNDIGAVLFAATGELSDAANVPTATSSSTYTAQVYTESEPGKPRKVTGHVTTATVTLEYKSMRTLENAARNMPKAVRSSFLMGFRHVLRDDGPLKTKALAAASADAKMRAEAMASATGNNVVKILSIASNDSIHRSPYGARSYAEASDFKGSMESLSANVPVVIGKVHVRASVTVVAEIAPDPKK